MFKKAFVIAALFVAVSGCTQIAKVGAPLDYTTGVSVSAAQMSTFVDKKTTKNDVIEALGQPGNKSEVAGTEIWSYGYTFIPGIPFTSKKNVSETTVFEFDKRGVLSKHYKTAANTQNTNPLLNAAGL
jgi:outer membrane protein assembly factor BamE (lipoprotein component of BamABCDE complex)